MLLTPFLAPAVESAPIDDLEVVQVRPEFYVLVGAGANIAINVGTDGVVVVDTGAAAHADQVLALIRKLTSQPIRYIINTSADPDHTGGNEKLSQAGQPILPTGYQREILQGRNFSPVLAEQHVQDSMAANSPKHQALPTAGWPTSTYSIEAGEAQRKLYLNGQGIQVMYQRSAYSDGDSLVLFRKSDVIVSGEIVNLEHFPVVDSGKGGSIQGLIDSLNTILDMSITSTPFPYQEGGTLLVPGHGRVCTVTDIVEYRDMLTIIRDRIADGIKQRRSLAQVEESNPTQGYRKRFGSDSGSWTTHMFVEAIYKELAQPGEPK